MRSQSAFSTLYERNQKMQAETEFDDEEGAENNSNNISNSNNKNTVQALKTRVQISTARENKNQNEFNSYLNHQFKINDDAANALRTLTMN